MGLFSFASKNKEEAASAEGEFYSRAEDESQIAGGRQRKPRKSSKASKSNSPVDPVLPEKKRARRRLIGAVALVLAMIIGLPMLLDSEPKPVNDDIAIQIPSKDKPGALPAATPNAAAASAGASVSMTAPAASASAAVAPAASLGQQEQIINLPPPAASAGKPAVPNPATPVRMPPPATANTANTAASATPATAAAPKPRAKDEVKPEAKPESKPEAKPEAKVADAKPQVKLEHNDARAEAILEGKDNGAKADAEKKPGKFIVQVAALSSQEKVDELLGKLNEAGIKAHVQKVATDSGERVMRVRVGPFASKEEAESARAKLSKIGLSGKLLPSS